ncbi:MAG: hypothetical protein BZY73_06470 [SAR202 cluster bacterium Casp-Chloro-G3]|nr:hypothetical protein [Chloroflexota bacterium]PKB56788.1 MAG: hypothetical protein BZY73_06470 [SAR202 cluster bacterium Casp-Chloro-G3]
MPGDNPLNRDAFLYLAAQAGLDTASPHLAELYPYVVSVLSSVRALDDIDVGTNEPDLAFIPSPEAN